MSSGSGRREAMTLAEQIYVQSASPTATRARNDHVIYGAPELSSSSRSDKSPSPSSADRFRKAAMANVLLKPDDSDSSGTPRRRTRVQVVPSGGVSPPHVDTGAVVAFETSRGEHEAAGSPTATYVTQEAGDPGEELPSKGSALHNSNACKPCLFLTHVLGCKDGSDCKFCHYHHSYRSLPRQSKSKRDRFQRLLMKIADDDKPGELKPRQAGLVVRSPVDGSPTGGATSSGAGAASSSSALPSRSMMMSL